MPFAGAIVRIESLLMCPSFRTRTLLLLFLALAASRSSAAANPIQTENAAAGTSEWQLTKPGFASGVIEGYAAATSVNAGGSIALFVNTRESSYAIDVFRMGYYGGLGGRR